MQAWLVPKLVPMLTLLISMLNWLNLMLGWLALMLTWVNMLDAQGDLFLDKVFLLLVFLFNSLTGNYVSGVLRRG
jgi:hypothetical protein